MKKEITLEEMDYLKADMVCKIEKIEELLEKDEMLEQYLLDLEKGPLKVPISLESSIKSKIQEESIRKKVEKNIQEENGNFNFLNLIKVACFTLIVMVCWFGMSNIGIHHEKEEQKEPVKEENKISAICGKVNEYTNMFSNLLLNPVERERGKVE